MDIVSPRGLISASELIGAVDSYNSNRGDRAPIEEIDLFQANLYNEGKDVVYFSKENIQNLNGTSVWIYDTNRKEEFTGLICQEKTYFTGDGENRQEHVALYVSDEQIEEGEENEQNEGEGGEEEGGEEEQADDNEQENQNEMQFEEHNVDNPENNENNAEEKNQEQQPEQEQPQVKLTLKLLENPDVRTKELFAEMDLKAFLDKAKTDMAEQINNADMIRINLKALCGGDKTLLSKVSLDILLQYPWIYEVSNLTPGIVDQIKHNESVQRLDCVAHYSNFTSFWVIPELKPESDGVLKVIGDVEYFAQTRFGLFCSLAASASLRNKDPIKVIDFSDTSIRDASKLSALAGYPIELNLAGLEEKLEKVKDDPETRKVSDTLQLVREDNGLFKVWCQPKDSLDKVFRQHPMLLQRLKDTLKPAFCFRTYQRNLEKAADAWKCDSFKSKYCFRKCGDGWVPKAFSTGFLNEKNRSCIISLINGEKDVEFLRAWEEFIRKIDGSTNSVTIICLNVCFFSCVGMGVWIFQLFRHPISKNGRILPRFPSERL